MRRCKLISPTNLMLEHPILSPVAETEYVLLGVKEFEKFMRERLIVGLLAGAFAAMMVATFLKILIGR